jgi:hypothetical protein
MGDYFGRVHSKISGFNRQRGMQAVLLVLHLLAGINIITSQEEQMKKGIHKKVRTSAQIFQKKK